MLTSPIRRPVAVPFILLLLLILFVPLAEAAPCCKVTAIDPDTGVVSAEETATGSTFEFNLLKRDLENLQVGSPLEADLEARRVLFGDRSVSIRKMSRAGNPRSKPSQPEEETPPAPRSTPAHDEDGEQTDQNDEPDQETEDSSTSTDDSTAATPKKKPSTPPVEVDRSVVMPAAEPSTSDPIRGKKKTPPPTTTSPVPPTPPITASEGSTATAIRGKKSPPPPTTTSPPNSYRNPRSPRAPAPRGAKPCYVGGCSGQVCSDKAGVITTCESRPEYACYKTAACERQLDGQCGWTQTSALKECLSNPPSN